MRDRCPSCGALVRPDAPWCTLCYADLRPDPAPVPAGDVSVPAEAMASAHLGPPSARRPAESTADGQPPAPPARGWPCSRCGAIVDFALSECDGCGAAFMAPGARVAAHPDALQRLVGVAGNKNAHLAIMAGGGLALLAVIVGVLAIIGSFL